MLAKSEDGPRLVGPGEQPYTVAVWAPVLLVSPLGPLRLQSLI